MELNEPIALIGLGALGTPFGANLLESGAELRVYNRTESKARALAEKGAIVATRPCDAITPHGVVFSLLWDDQSVEDVVSSEGFLETLGEGGVHVSMSTISPEGARRIATMHDRVGATMIAAPVFGRPEAAVARNLIVAMSGPSASKQRIEPFLTAAGVQKAFDFGEDHGAALAVKVAGNFLIVSAAQSIFEALAMAGSYGVDKTALMDMLTSTLFPAPIYKNYGKLVIDGSPPMIESPLARKDVGLFDAAARNAGLQQKIPHALLS